MGKFAQLIQDIEKLWQNFGEVYLRGIRSTLILALVATALGCLIGFACGVLNTIPTRKRPSAQRFVLKLIRVVIRIYVEVSRTPMMLQAVFIFYACAVCDESAA